MDEYEPVRKSADPRTCDTSPFQMRAGPSWSQEAAGGRKKLPLRPNLILFPSLNVPVTDVPANTWALILPLTSFNVVLSGALFRLNRLIWLRPYAPQAQRWSGTIGPPT